MKKKLLGVNIDHVATLRNARGEKHPEPVVAALLAQKSGANSITIHLREDRRHIIDEDLYKIKKKIIIPLNLEISPTNKMVQIACKFKPNYVCLVPEKREEITTEGGLNVFKKNLKKLILKLKKKNIRVSVFIEPEIQDIKKSKDLGVDCIEIHTGNFCRKFHNKKNFLKEYNKIKNASRMANNLKLKVHAGHGLNYKSTNYLVGIKEISEFNIGHFIIGESIEHGLTFVIKKFLKILKK